VENVKVLMMTEMVFFSGNWRAAGQRCFDLSSQCP